MASSQHRRRPKRVLVTSGVLACQDAAGMFLQQCRRPTYGGSLAPETKSLLTFQGRMIVMNQQPSSFWVRHAALVFGLKTFAAAMLAYSIAVWLDTPRPYWAMASVFITSNPLT